MFLNKTMFKRWIKDAFRHNGLVVGRIYGGLVISGGAWATWTKEGYVPNWLKAAIMEHTGELPNEGEVFKAKKDEVQQYEVSENPYLDLPKRLQEARIPFSVIPVIYATRWASYRLIQCRMSGEVIPIPSEYYDIIDIRETEHDGTPAGPSSRDETGRVLIWKNETSALAVSRSEMSEEGSPILKVLKGLKFEEVPL